MESRPVTAAMHVLTLTPFYPTTQDDANGCFVAEPLSALASLGVRNSVVVGQPFYRESAKLHSAAPSAKFVRYFSLPSGAGLPTAGAFLLARILGQIRELHLSHKIDVIHAHGPLPCGHAAMLLSRELKIPYVVTVHGLDAYSTRQVSGRAGEWCRRVSARVFRSAGRVICISEHVREQVFAGSKNAATAVVYNGVDAERFSPAAKEAGGPPSLLSVGNLIPIKGHGVLLRAMSAIASAHPELKLEIVGDGPERAGLVRLACELGLVDRVRFWGRMPRQEVARFLRECTVFVLPSRYEALGCVYLEAMATGKVAIGCQGQGIEEVIRHGSNGWLVAPESTEQLAAAMSTLLAHTMLRRYIGEQARHTILNGFTLAKQAEQLLRVYRESHA